MLGEPGSGKSTILRLVIERMPADVPVLASRVDQTGAIAGLEQLGKQLVGRADNPAVRARSGAPLRRSPRRGDGHVAQQRSRSDDVEKALLIEASPSTSRTNPYGAAWSL